MLRQLNIFCSKCYLIASVDDAVGVMVSVVDQLLSGRADLVAAVGVDREVGLEGVVLLQQALHGSHVLAQVWHGQQLLLLRDPKSYRKNGLSALVLSLRLN